MRSIQMVLGLALLGGCPQPDPSSTGSAGDLPREQGTEAVKSGPKLVVYVVVDQFPLRLLEAGKPWYTEGFARLTGPESWAGTAKYAHAITFTCPGHATLSTGAAPSVHGIASNDWMVEAQEGEVFTPIVGRTAEYRNEYCVPDGDLGNLKAEPLGDVVKEAGGKVVALSLKDRGAALLGGHHPDAVGWFDKKANRFTGPAWADEAADWERRLQREWTPLIPEAVATREDQRNIEHDPGSDELPIGITFPHPALKDAGHPALLATPFSGEALTDVAIGAIHALKLGEDEIPDLLTVSYSHTDYIGHNFTAESAEALDNIIRLDRELGKLMKVLDEDVGKGRWTMVLSSDHGGADGNATARVSIGDLVAKADEGFRTVEAEGQISFEDPAIWLPKAVRHDPVRRKAAAEAVAKALEGFPGVAAVIPWRDGGVAESAPFREAVALSLRDESSGDLYVLLSDGALYQYRSPPDFGTSHGTPYDYDALVPLLAVGAGIVPNGAPPQVDVRQIAPTVAALLGARAPKDAQLGGVEAMLAK